MSTDLSPVEYEVQHAANRLHSLHEQHGGEPPADAVARILGSLSVPARKLFQERYQRQMSLREQIALAAGGKP